MLWGGPREWAVDLSSGMMRPLSYSPLNLFLEGKDGLAGSSSLDLLGGGGDVPASPYKSVAAQRLGWGRAQGQGN